MRASQAVFFDCRVPMRSGRDARWWSASARVAGGGAEASCRGMLTCSGIETEESARDSAGGLDGVPRDALDAPAACVGACGRAAGSSGEGGKKAGLAVPDVVVEERVQAARLGDSIDPSRARRCVTWASWWSSWLPMVWGIVARDGVAMWGVRGAG